MKCVGLQILWYYKLHSELCFTLRTNARFLSQIQSRQVFYSSLQDLSVKLIITKYAELQSKRHFLADLLYSHTVALSVIRISIPNVYSVQWIALVISWVSKILKTVYSAASFAALCKEGKESILLSKSTSRSSVSFSKRSTSNYKKLHQTASVTHIQTEWLHYDNTMNRIFVDLHISSQWWHQRHCQLSMQCGKMESIKRPEL